MADKLFTKKIVNARGETIELPEGQELNQELRKVSNAAEFNNRGSKLVSEKSSLLTARYFSEIGVTWADVKRAMNPDVFRRSVGELFTNDNTAPLFTTLIEDYVRGAYERTGRADQLLMGVVPISQQTSSFYVAENLEDEDLTFNKIAQGAPIPVTTIKLANNRSIQVYKRGGGVELTDEAKSMNIDMLAGHLKRRGQRMSRVDEMLAVETLINGYFDDGYDTPKVIGVKEVGKISLIDMWHATVYMQEVLGFTPDRVIMNAKTSELWATTMLPNNQYLFLDELRNGETPNVIKSVPFISEQMADGQIMFVDTDFALQEYVYKALSTENDRNVKTQIEGSYTTKTAGYVPFETNARVIMDASVLRT